MRLLIASLVLVALAMPAFAQEDVSALHGRRITVQPGDRSVQDVPLAVSYEEGPASEERVTVVDPATGQELPTTMRGGELAFIPQTPAAGEQQVYEVRVGGEKQPELVQIVPIEGEKALRVLIRGRHFTTYHYSNDVKKPYLWPVYAEGAPGSENGEPITRAWPMGDKEQSDDHLHHRSCWTAYGDVNGVDLWAEGKESGYQNTEDVRSGNGDAYGWIRATNTWQDSSHQPLLTEEREYRFYATLPQARIMDVFVTFKATNGDVLFRDTKEGGIVAVRVRDAITEKAGGTIANAAGGVGMAQCWGKPAAWCDYSGNIEGVGVRGIAIFDHPDNLRHPTAWHVRDYGLMGANCFGYSHFTEGAEKGDLLVKADDTLTFRYRVFIHSGDAQAARVDAHYADYATPPQASW